MSVRVMSWVWEHSEAEGSDRLVLLAIADQAGDAGGHAWPSVQTIAGKARVSVRTAQRSIKSLVALGELSVDVNAGRNGVNVYRVNMTPRQDDTRTERDKGSVSLSPRQIDGVTPVTPSGDTGVTRTILNHPSSTHLEGGTHLGRQSDTPLPVNRCPDAIASGETCAKPCGLCKEYRLATDAHVDAVLERTRARAKADADAARGCKACFRTGRREDGTPCDHQAVAS